MLVYYCYVIPFLGEQVRSSGFLEWLERIRCSVLVDRVQSSTHMLSSKQFKVLTYPVRKDLRLCVKDSSGFYTLPEVHDHIPYS